MSQGITIDHEGATYRLTIDGEVKNADHVIRTITDFIKASEYCHKHEKAKGS